MTQGGHPRVDDAILDMDDATLVRRARERSAPGRLAYDQLVARHEPALVRHLDHLLGDVGLAEDVAQTAFLQAYLALERFRGDARFSTWLRSIASRAAFNHMRGSGRRRGYEAAAPIPDAPDPDPVATADLVRAVLTALPHPYREVLLLRHLDELSVQEVSEVLDISLSAAKMRLSRARARFLEVHAALTEPHAS